MLRIYLPSSTDLKLCSDVPIVNFVDTWTFVTIFTSRHLSPNIWVLAKGSKMICQPLEHLLGGSRHMGLGIWVFPMSNLNFMCLVLLDPGPKTSDPYCMSRFLKNVYAFTIKNQNITIRFNRAVATETAYIYN